MSKRKPDTPLAKAIRDLQNEIDSKIVMLKALREQYDSDEVDYYGYIQTEAWREQRMKILRRDNFQCVCCGTAKNLHVHHITYENLGAEEEGDLVTLCSSCHANVHSMEDIKKSEIEIPKRKIPDGLTRDEFDLLVYATALGDDYFDIEEKYQIAPWFFESFKAKEIAGNFTEGAFLGGGVDEAVEDRLNTLRSDSDNRMDNLDIVRDMYFALLFSVTRKAFDYIEEKLISERAWSNNKESIDEKLKFYSDYIVGLRERIGEL